MSEAEKNLPGVSLEFRTMTELNGWGGSRIDVRFIARVEDHQLWERVKPMLQAGLRFGDPKDMATQLNDVLRDENNKYERRINVLEAEIREERINVDALTTRIKQLERALSVIGLELDP